MTKEERDAIRAQSYTLNPKLAISICEKVPALLDALDEAEENHRIAVNAGAHAIKQLTADCDRRQARAEALERALSQLICPNPECRWHLPCHTCENDPDFCEHLCDENGNSDIDMDEPCLYWIFDEARFSKKEKIMKPIMFCTDMVPAILQGRKTQTRRVIKPQSAEVVRDGKKEKLSLDEFIKTEKDALLIAAACAQYQPGDVLWVRETWCPAMEPPYEPRLSFYKASPETYEDCMEDIKWRSPIQMPRAAARIFLRVTDVRVERVQEISEEDARAEGVTLYGVTRDEHEARSAYRELWNSLNAKRGYGWDTNPWVWVYTFERMENPADII